MGSVPEWSKFVCCCLCKRRGMQNTCTCTCRYCILEVQPLLIQKVFPLLIVMVTVMHIHIHYTCISGCGTEWDPVVFLQQS